MKRPRVQQAAGVNASAAAEDSYRKKDHSKPSPEAAGAIVVHVDNKEQLAGLNGEKNEGGEGSGVPDED
eukprot:6198351-Pleurochrysis_carterae.AAC.1